MTTATLNLDVETFAEVENRIDAFKQLTAAELREWMKANDLDHGSKRANIARLRYLMEAGLAIRDQCSRI